MTKLILIDGIFGSGKSTVTKNISQFLTLNNISNHFYEEEAEDNPLYTDDCEIVKGSDETHDFIKKTKELWQNFVNEINNSNEVHILESAIFQNSTRVLFNNLYDSNAIHDYYAEILDILRDIEPILIYLRKKNIQEAINKIWMIRGKGFKDFCIEYDQKTKYCEENNLLGENSTINLWSNFQNITDDLFELYDHKKIKFETDIKDWDTIYSEIFNLLIPDKKNKAPNRA